MRVRDVMSTDVVTVGPDTSIKYAGEVMAARGFAALPVTDDGKLVGLLSEADVLRNRLPEDPRLHLRPAPEATTPPPLLVRAAMTDRVESIGSTVDIADLARIFVDRGLRSVPVVDGGRLVGIVSRRDLLRALVRPDAKIAAELEHLVEAYTAADGCWDVAVREGMATIRRIRGMPDGSPAAEERVLHGLARTVGGVLAVTVLPPVGAPDRPAVARH